MLSLRSFTTAIALALVTGCARQETPAASAAAPAAMPAPLAIDGDASANANANANADAAADPDASTPAAAAEAPSAQRTNNELEGSAPPLARGDTISLGSVRIGNQRPLKAVAIPFATYLNAIHAPIHREFSDKRLAQLDSLAPSDPLNRPKLVVRLELVIDGASGKVTKVGVVKPSGVTAFDVLAVDSVMQAGPFSEAPAEIRSTDGNVYVHWEFGRDPTFGCSTMHVRPFLLTLAPRAVTTP